MLKMIFLCHRRPDIDHDEYARRVLEDHVPLALRHHPTMRQYVVNIVARIEMAGSAEVDSIAELSFDSLEDYRDRLYDSDAGQRIIGADVARFMHAAEAYACSEHVHVGSTHADAALARAAPFKLVVALTRHSGLSHEEFVEHWLTRHAPLALERHPGLVRYVTNVVDSRLSPAGEDFDGIAELHFASEAAFVADLYRQAAGLRLIEADMPDFLGSVQGWIVAEHVMKVPS